MKYNFFIMLLALVVGLGAMGTASAHQVGHQQYQHPQHQIFGHQNYFNHHHNHGGSSDNGTQPPANDTNTTPVDNNTTPVDNGTTPTDNGTDNGTTPISNGTNITPTTIVNGGSIQTAIDNAKTGDVIQVNGGTYSGFTINKGIVLIGNGIVNINSPVTITGSGATLNGFTILKQDYALTITSVNNVSILNNVINSQLNGLMSTGTCNNLLVAYNHFIGYDQLYGNNIAFESVVSNSVVRDNYMEGAEFCLLFDKASTNDIVSGNTMMQYGNLVHPGDPIVTEGVGFYTVDGSTNFQILNNTIINSRDAIALQQIGSGTSSGFLVQGNIVKDSLNGIWMTVNNSIFKDNTLINNTNSIDLTGTGNLIEYNTMTGSKNCDVALTTSKSTDVNTLMGNIIDGSPLYYNVGSGKVVGE